MFHRRKRPPSGPKNMSVDALLLATYANAGDDRSPDAAIKVLLERGGLDAQQLSNDDTFLLGHLLKRRYDVTGSLNDLQWGLNYLQRATHATPRSSPDRGPRLQYLAESLLQAVEAMEPGESTWLVTSHLNVAREWLTESLALAGTDRRATCRSSLGTALLLRMTYLGEADAAPRGLAELRRACSEPASPQVRAACYGNYAKGLMTVHHPDRSRLLDEAIAAFRQALALCPAGSPDRLAHTRNLITALEAAGQHAEAQALRHELRR
jgi:hypothetical protein